MRKGKVTAASALELVNDILDGAEQIAGDLGAKRNRELDVGRELIWHLGNVGESELSMEEMRKLLNTMNNLQLFFTQKQLDQIAVCCTRHDVYNCDVEKVVTKICEVIATSEEGFLTSMRHTPAVRKAIKGTGRGGTAKHGKGKKGKGSAGR